MFILMCIVDLNTLFILNIICTLNFILMFYAIVYLIVLVFCM